MHVRVIGETCAPINNLCGVYIAALRKLQRSEGWEWGRSKPCKSPSVTEVLGVEGVVKRKVEKSPHNHVSSPRVVATDEIRQVLTFMTSPFLTQRQNWADKNCDEQECDLIRIHCSA